MDPLRAAGRHGLRTIAIVALALWLTGCGIRATPPSASTVERAVVLSALRARATLVDRFGGRDRWDNPLEPEDVTDAAAVLGVRVQRVRSRDRTSLSIDGQPGYRIRGTYDLQSQREDRSDRAAGKRNAFEIYLQLQSEGKTWRLAYPDPSAPDNDTRWLTDRLR